MPSSRKQDMIEAALTVIKQQGFAGCTSRAIAKEGGFNQALIYYHYRGVNELLLAALDASSERRLKRYREAVETCTNPAELILVAARLYREDLEDGHITVLSEMIAGSLAHHELRAEMIHRMEPWIDFAEEQIEKIVLADSPFGSLLPPRPMATAVVALYLGIDLLGHLDEKDGRVDEMFNSAEAVAQLVAPLVGSQS